MTARFMFRGVAYMVTGTVVSRDGACYGAIVSRVDGRPIRGARMRPGMLQVGLSRGLERAADAALWRHADEENARNCPVRGGCDA